MAMKQLYLAIHDFLEHLTYESAYDVFHHSRLERKIPTYTLKQRTVFQRVQRLDEHRSMLEIKYSLSQITERNWLTFNCQPVHHLLLIE
jgi:hypothetical protein